MDATVDLREIGLFVLCWERRQEKNRDDWLLCHVLGVDRSGHPVEVPSHALPDGVHVRYAGAVWDFWMRPDRMLSVGVRAVTGWSFAAGVRLMDLRLPDIGGLLQLPDELEQEWFRFVKDGHQLFLGTERAVREVFFK